MPIHQGQTLRFGPFTLDPRCGELRTNGSRIKLQGQPIQVLELLLEKPGELVTREEIRQKLWSSDTFVDFDHNLNTAIKKLRQALGDEADTPHFIETVPKYGYRFIGEVAQEEERQPTASTGQVTPEQQPQHRPKMGRTILISAGLVAALLLSTFLSYRLLHPQPPLGSRIPVRSQLKLLGSSPNGRDLSRDGRYLLYWRDPTGQIWIKDLQEGTDEPLPGTEGAGFPFWSPDGRYIGFFTDTPRRLKKIALDSRIITEICALDTGFSSWGTSKVILVDGPVGLKAVSVATGRIQMLSEAKTDWVDANPVFLPDGKHFLFVRVSRNRYFTRGASGVLYVGSLDGRPPRTLDIRVVGYALYAAGRLLYTTHHGLFSQPFDPSGLRVLGKPTLLIPASGNGIYFTASENGILVSHLSEANRLAVGESELRLLTPHGKPASEVFAQGYTDQPRFSPDGKRVAYDRIIGDNRDIWIYDLERHVNTRLTPGDSMYSGPVWSPDGKRIAYQYRHTHVRGIAVRNADGGGEQEILFEHTNEGPLYYGPRSWSATNNCLFITVMEPPNGLRKIGVLCLKGDRKLTVLPAPKNSSRTYPIVSPDGKWLAYSSNEAGGSKVFLEPYPGAGENIPVFSGNGSHPQWRADGRELFFRSAGKVQAVSITYEGNKIRIGQPISLFAYVSSVTDGSTFDPSPDGQLFVVNSARVPILPTDTVDLITNFDLLVKK